MFNTLVLDGLLSNVSNTPVSEWSWFGVLAVVLACISYAAVGSLIGTSKNFAYAIIVLFILPLLILAFIFNFILRCMGKEPLSLDFLKDLLPWGVEKHKEAETAPTAKDEKHELPART